MGERRGGRLTTDDSLALDIRRLQRAGMLTAGRACGWQWTVHDRVRASIQIRAHTRQVHLLYRYRADDQPVEEICQAVVLERTPCTLGGSRPWFRCSACSRRVAVIYGGGRLFACRQCKGLGYASQRESSCDRATRRANRIRKQLGWPVGIFNGAGSKPKGMHWATYLRLTAEHNRLMEQILDGIARQFGFLERLRGEGLRP